MAEPAGPAPRLNRSQNKFNLEEALIPFRRREWVIQEIGKESLEPFELWAFPKVTHPMIYDAQISFHWANGHSTKCVSHDPDQAIQQIVAIWKERFRSIESDSDDRGFPILIHCEDEPWRNNSDFGD